MNITTEQIAKELNISRGTVSRALNGSKGVNEETKQKVLEAAERMGYKPNKAARSLVMKKKYSIGVVVFSEPQYFWKEVRQGIARAEQELYDYGVSVEYIMTDIKNPEEQISAIRKLIDMGVDAIALSPNNPDIVADFIDEVSEKGIPVLTFSSDIPHSRRICYVGSDYIQSGRLAGEVMGKLLNGNGKVAVLTFAQAVLSIQQRIIGFREVIGQYPKLEIMGPYKLSRTGEDVYDFTVKLIKENPDLNGIFVTYGKTEVVGRALMDIGKQKEIKVIGYDLSDEIIELLKQDVLQAIICQEPFNQGYYSVKLLYNYIVEGKKPTLSIVNTKLEAVFRENVNCYRAQENYYNLLYNI